MSPKVLFSASTYSHIRNFHLPYLAAFQRMGWETHVACAHAPQSAPFADRVIQVPFEKSMTAPSNIKAALMLRRLIRRERYDLITTHTSLAAFFTRLAVKGMQNCPKVVNVVHGYLFDDETPSFKRRLLLDAERLTAPETDLLLTMNEWDFRTAQRYHLGARIEKIPGIGVDFSRLDDASPEDGAALREQYGIADAAFVLIYAAEFSRRKSQHVLIRALKQLPDSVMLVLPGSGALLEECRDLAQRLEVADRVIFPGQVDNMPAWYRAADAAVSASRSEGLPFNVMEAMYAHLPVVASAVKGHTDLIEDGVTGLLVPYGDAAACAGQIRKLLEEPLMCERLCQKTGQKMNDYDRSKVLPAVMAKYIRLTGDLQPYETTNLPFL